MRKPWLPIVSFALAACSGASSSPGPIDSGSGADGAPDSAASDDAGEGDAGQCGATPKQATPECQRCQDTQCCINASACTSTPSSWSCSGAKICRENLCAQECGTAAATCGNIVFDPASCTAATRAACCNEITACAQSDECVALIYQCIDGMGCAPGSTCFAACRKQWPTGAKLFDNADACVSTVSCP